MKAIVFDQSVALHHDYPMPTPGDGEALVKVRMAGVCNTDLEIMKGYMQFSGILGHEFVGVVSQVNGSDGGLLNRRVVGEINCACGSCPLCKQGLYTHCSRRSVLGIAGKDGCFAEYLTLPITNLHVVQDEIDDEAATFVEPLAAAFQIGEQVHLKPTDSILVLGDGKLGLLITLALNLSPGIVCLAGNHPKKLAIAEAVGVETVPHPQLDAERKFDIVVDATGSSAGFGKALSHVRPRGTLVLKSTVADAAALNLAPLVINEVTLVGSRCGPFRPAIDALAKERVDVKPLIDHVFYPDAFSEALEKSRTKGTLKVLLDFRTESGC